MKGRVFTEFFEHVERRYGFNMVEDVLDIAALPHDGIYTSTGSYPFQEMVSLIGALVKKTGESMPSVLEAFGTHCFESWVSYAPHYFYRGRHLFDILQGIDEFHEFEVRKLYPDAELPSFVPEVRDAHAMTLGYYSCKPLASLALGVIRGAATHVEQKVDLSFEAADGPRGPYTRIFVQMTD